MSSTEKCGIDPGSRWDMGDDLECSDYVFTIAYVLPFLFTQIAFQGFQVSSLYSEFY